MAVHPLTAERRAQMCAWLRDNDIDPATVPEDCTITLAHGPAGPVIRYAVYETDDTGKIVAVGAEPVRLPRESPLLVSPPAQLRIGA